MQRSEKRIPLATPTMHTEELEFIKEAFDRNWIAPLGFNVDGFEEEMIQYLTKGEYEYNALALDSGTSALHMAVKLAGVKRGDIVFCSDMTFAASVNPAVYEGAVPVFIDSERDTWNMDPKALRKAFEKYPDTKVVILVHLYGTPAKIDEITEICNEYGAIIIEDAAESLTATYKGKQTGTFGKYNAISFNGNKLITTSGGGMLLTESKEARQKAFFWSTQSKEPYVWYEHKELGYNYRLSNVTAGIGRGQLRHLQEHRDIKEVIYRRYEEGFKGLPMSMCPYEKENAVPNFWLSCVLFDKSVEKKPMEIYDELNALNIETRPIWKPMHMQPIFSENDFIYVEETPVDEDIFSRGLCLPSDIKMTAEEQDFVIAAIKEAVK